MDGKLTKLPTSPAVFLSLGKKLSAIKTCGSDTGAELKFTTEQTSKVWIYFWGP